MKHPRPTFSLFLLPFIWMAVIFYLSHQPVLPSFEVFYQDFLLKKIAHLTAYAILFWSWFLAFKKNHLAQSLTQKTWPLILLLCFLFALSDEYHQSFIPGRTATLRDIAYDSLGTTLAFLWSYRLI